MKNKMEKKEEDNIEIMIQVLIKKCNTTNFYNKTSSVDFKTVEPTVDDYIRELKAILNFPLDKNLLQLKNLNLNNYKRFIDWYSDSGYIFNNNDRMKLFLELSYRMIQFCKSEEGNEFVEANKMRLTTYYLNIKEIIEYIYKHC